MNCAVLIPAYNPDAQLPELAGRILAHGPATLIVVDDGSSADCAAHFRALEELEGVTLLRHKKNLGKGAALKTGLAYLERTFPGAQYALLVDADGQHHVEDVVRVAEEAEGSDGALVIGARAFEGRVPLRSRIGNGLTRFIFNTVTGLGLEDTQSGLRAVPTALIPALLELDSSRYEFELDMLFLCRRQNVAVAEIPIRTIYLGGNSSSHFNPVLDSIRVYRRLLANALRHGGAGFPGRSDGAAHPER
jgi:glycosyltransferase involved in cell wall biosynthesis